jgi:pSer/pThr/pTyr-binding forkhead associated (FHA) protein
VSGHHAIIVRDEKLFYIVDNKSTNGVFLNGRRIAQAQLLYGDEITIFKHKLKFVAVDLSAETSGKATINQNAIVEDQTVAINKAQLKTLLQQQRDQEPYLVQTGGSNHGQRWLLSKQTFDIGKNRACDLYIGGWFAPQLGAVITRQSDGYYLMPEKRGKVYLNHQPISGRVKLQNYDNLQIRGIDLTFYQPHNSAL